jgi:hypothetical protein
VIPTTCRGGCNVNTLFPPSRLKSRVRTSASRVKHRPANSTFIPPMSRTRTPTMPRAMRARRNARPFLKKPTHETSVIANPRMKCKILQNPNLRPTAPRGRPPRQEPASPSISVPQEECQESPPTIPQPPTPLIISPPSPVLAVSQHGLVDPAITIHQEPTTPTVPVLAIQGERQESPITISQQPATAAIPPGIPVLAVGQHELVDPAITIHQEPTTPTVPIPSIQKERQESPIVEQPPPPTPPVGPISQADDKPQEKSLTESGSSSGTKLRRRVPRPPHGTRPPVLFSIKIPRPPHESHPRLFCFKASRNSLTYSARRWAVPLRSLRKFYLQMVGIWR